MIPRRAMSWADADWLLLCDDCALGLSPQDPRPVVVPPERTTARGCALPVGWYTGTGRRRARCSLHAGRVAVVALRLRAGVSETSAPISARAVVARWRAVLDQVAADGAELAHVTLTPGGELGELVNRASDEALGAVFGPLRPWDGGEPIPFDPICVPEAGGGGTEPPPLTPTRLVRQRRDNSDGGSAG